MTSNCWLMRMQLARLRQTRTHTCQKRLHDFPSHCGRACHSMECHRGWAWIWIKYIGGVSSIRLILTTGRDVHVITSNKYQTTNGIIVIRLFSLGFWFRQWGCQDMSAMNSREKCLWIKREMPSALFFSSLQPTFVGVSIFDVCMHLFMALAQ